MPNMPEGIYVLYALNAIGAVSCLIDPRTAPVGIKNYINEVHAKVLVVIDLCADKIATIVSETTLTHVVIAPVNQSMPFAQRLFVRGTRTNDKLSKLALMWSVFIKAGKNTRRFECKSYVPNAVAVIGHTGGTTGIPKGVELTNEAYNMLSFQQQYTSFMKEGTTSLDIMPLFSAYGSAFGIHIPLCAGKRLILIPKFKPEEFVDLILKYKPNHAVGVPAFWEFLAESPKSQNMDMSFLKSAVVGGDKLNPETERFVNHFFETHFCKTKLAKGYGLIETCSCFTYTLEDVCNAAESVGLPLYKNNCKIVSPGTCTEIGYNKIGEICLSGPTLMRGYYNNPEATRAAIKKHEDGAMWLHTGDLGKIKDDGLLYIEGRIKRIIIGPNGHNVFPSLSEDIIAKHPQVEACAVVGKIRSSVKNGVIPTAYVVLKLGNSDTVALKNDLDAMCKMSLPECDCPYEYEFIDALPLTSLGKVDFRALENETT